MLVLSSAIARLTSRILLVLVLSLSATACAAFETALGPPTIDGEIGGDTEDGCGGIDDLGNLGFLDIITSLVGSIAGDLTGDEQLQAAFSELDALESDKALSVDLISGQGPFADGYRTGTIPLEGIQADPQGCSACVGLVLQSEEEMVGYHARSGTLSIDSVDPTPFIGGIRGTLTDVVFQPVDLSSRQLLPGGCSKRVGSASFRLPISGFGL